MMSGRKEQSLSELEHAELAKLKTDKKYAQLTGLQLIKLACLNAEIVTLKAQKRRTLAHGAKTQRQIENRRKALAGAAVLDEAQGDPEYRAQLYRLLSRFLQRDDERLLFGFEPLSERPELVVNHAVAGTGTEAQREAEPA